MNEITKRLRPMDREDRQAASELLPQVYDELKRLAATKMASERMNHSLGATALVHEAYLRLAGSADDRNWDGRAHFFAAAAEAMRRILVDHARNARRLKRGGDARRLTLESIDLIWKPQYGDVVELSDAIDALAEVAPEAAELVKLRCFAGQSIAEAAALMGISVRTAKRRWAFARAWLFKTIEPLPPG